MKSTYSLLAAALACGIASAETTAYTTPVGYETLKLKAGFNYEGLRLHSPVAVAGTFETVTSTTLTDTGSGLGAILDDSTNYIVEITGGNGAITVVLGSAAVGDSLTVTDDLTLAGVTAGASYRIRPAATLASVFGAANTAGLTEGFFGPGGADLVYVYVGGGNFTFYYYDGGLPGWANFEGTAVNPASVALVYTDSLIVSANNDVDLVVQGEVKTDNTLVALEAGFNYAASVYPAGATLASQFGLTDPPNLDYGFFGPGGADLVYMPDGLGDFNFYYYDSGLPGWADKNGSGVDASAISLTPGVIISNENGSVNLLNKVPSTYSSL